MTSVKKIILQSSLCLIQPPPACTAPATHEKLSHGEDFEGGAKIREDQFDLEDKVFRSKWVQSFSCSNSTSTTSLSLLVDAIIHGCFDKHTVYKRTHLLWFFVLWVLLQTWRRRSYTGRRWLDQTRGNVERERVKVAWKLILQNLREFFFNRCQKIIGLKYQHMLLSCHFRNRRYPVDWHLPQPLFFFLFFSFFIITPSQISLLLFDSFSLINSFIGITLVVALFY